MDNVRPYNVVRESGTIYGTYPDIGAARHALDVLEYAHRGSVLERSTVDVLILSDNTLCRRYEIVPA